MLECLFGQKTKTTYRHKGLFGEKITDVTYHDTGKKVRHVSRPGFFGGTVNKSYIMKPGKKR